MKLLFTLLMLLFLCNSAFSQQTVAYWHLDENSGNNVIDASSFHNDGVADTSAHIVQGILGNSRLVPKFKNKVGVSVPSSSSLDIFGNSPFTLEAFIKLDDYEQNGIVFIQKAGNYGLGLGSYGNTGKLQLFIWPNQTNAFVLQYNTQVPLNQWLHIAGTWDGTTAKLYINHQLVQSQNYTTPIGGGNSPLHLGGTGLNIQPTHNSIMDEIRITSAALDSNEFLQFPTTDVELKNINQISYGLDQNYPNPFNPSTKIRYNIPSAGSVSLKIYDILGNEVDILVDKEQSIGTYEVNFNSKISL